MEDDIVSPRTWGLKEKWGEGVGFKGEGERGEIATPAIYTITSPEYQQAALLLLS